MFKSLAAWEIQGFCKRMSACFGLKGLKQGHGIDSCRGGHTGRQSLEMVEKRNRNVNREIRELGQKNGNVGKQSPKSLTLNVMSA